ncbi:hypothetical protein NHF50_11730 [Flavobacterium sp. NRK F10]|uniref:Carboxypeptidase-like regulatory domain-containing protein n=1 Tax=Flavobacterium sediminis TaxID=2201181 RepID=A0A2U8QW99_9FLAO|nr:MULTISPECIES: hypothetical protein [Flavobacterium]AWM14482.1 hypothetical protein DI487_11860 [Flavobacterium sediminis]MCO6175711.1 hypothetical protein [Flavobacterium sp. NRK F10]
MRKILLLFFIAAIYTTGFSQATEFTIIVKDIDTDTPVDEVTITALKTRQGFLTNGDGVAKVNLSRKSDLELVHSSYKPLIVRYASLNQKENVIYLESNLRLLEEVILTKRHPQEILKDLVENSMQHVTVPANLKVYLREFYKKNDNYVFFNDGLLNFQILGSPEKIKTDILIEQNRTVGLLDGDINEDVLGYNLNNIMENYYQFKYLNEVLNKKALKDYDFQVKTFPQNENYLAIKISPLEEAKGVLSNFYIVYDSTKKLIVEINSTIPSSRMMFMEESFFNKTNIYTLEYKNMFRIDGSLYYLTSSKEVIGFEKKYKKEKRKIEVRNYMVVTNFDTEIFGYTKENVFKDKSLINKRSTVFTPYWEFESGLTPTVEERKIITMLAE